MKVIGIFYKDRMIGKVCMNFYFYIYLAAFLQDCGQPVGGAGVVSGLGGGLIP